MIEIDECIIEQCKKSDRRAQMQLYVILYKRVYNTCFRIIRNPLEAEETMQEAFLKALSNLDNYNNIVPFEAWIVRIAINLSIDVLRRKSLDLVDLNENIHYDVVDLDDSGDWDEVVEKVEQVKAAIQKLPDTSRIIISLYLIEGYDHEEISEILNITTGASRIQYMRAKHKLMELL